MSKTKHNPSLVIGLGGTGKRGIQAVKRYIVENGKEGGLSTNYPYLNFLSFDSSTNLLSNEAVSKFDGLDAREIRIQNHEVVSLTSALKGFDISNYRELQEWFPEDMAPFLGAGIFAQGCQQNRVLGRFLFAWNYYQTIEPRLRRAIHSVKLDFQKAGVRAGTGKFHNVYLIGSLSGGTGSGMFLDMAYALRKVWYEELGDQRTLQIYAFVPGPSFFARYGATEYVIANHYSAMLEIDYFMNLKHLTRSTDRFSMKYPGENFGMGQKGDSTHPAFRLKPFDYFFSFDAATRDSGKSVEDAAFYEMVGSFVANMYGGELADGYYDVNSNSSPELTKYALNTGRPLAYSSMGMSTVLYPRNVVMQRLAEYLTIQIVVDLLHSDMELTSLETLVTRGVFDNVNPLEKWVSAQSFSEECQGALKTIVEKTRRGIESLEEEPDEMIARNSIAGLLNKETEKLYLNRKPALLAAIRSAVITRTQDYASELMGMKSPNQIAAGDSASAGAEPGDIAATISFLDALIHHLEDWQLRQQSLSMQAFGYVASSTEEAGVIQRILRRIPGIGDNEPTARERWGETVTREADRLRRLFFTYALKDAIGSEEEGLLRDLKRMRSETNAILVKMQELLKNLVPACDPSKQEDLKEIARLCQKPLLKEAPTVAPRFPLMNYGTPASPSLYVLLWRIQDLYDFYHGSEKIPGIVRVVDPKDGGDPQEVNVDELRDRKRQIVTDVQMENSLGRGFRNVVRMGVPEIKSRFIAAARKLFRKRFAHWNIEEAMNAMAEKGSFSNSSGVRTLAGLLEDTDIMLLLKEGGDSGALRLAGVDGSESSNNSMNFIFLPNLYAQRPCAEIKSSGFGKCPAQEDASIHCEKLDRCLKQVVLNSPKTFSIIHPDPVSQDDVDAGDYEWSQLHEIHVLKAFHGIPLQAMELQMTKGKEAFKNYRIEGRTLLIAQPRQDMADEEGGAFYDIEKPFPDEFRKELQRKALRLFAAGWLRYEESRRRYRFPTRASYEGAIKANQAFDLDGTIDETSDLLDYIRKSPQAQGLFDRPDFHPMFTSADLLANLILREADRQQQLQMYARLVKLRGDLRVLHPDRKEGSFDDALPSEKKLIDTILDELRAANPEIKAMFDRDEARILADIAFESPMLIST